ncbi:MAG TPA: DUF2752 domain-containing protein, partial [Chthoniobacterales bacterium]
RVHVFRSGRVERIAPLVLQQMQFSVRRRAAGDLDHELIWLSASILSLGFAAVWLAVGLPWPRCVFHNLTNLPCVTCGMTRCAIQFFHGHFLAALQWNPFVFAVLCAATLFDIYALVTVIARTPRLRLQVSTQRAKTFSRVSVVSALAVNWIYLLLHWRNF